MTSPPADSTREDAGSKAMIKKIDRKEKLVCFAASVLAAVGFAIVWVPHLHDHNASLRSSAQSYLVVGIVMAVALAGATALGRRALIGFVALFIGFGPWGNDIIGTALFLGLAAWLLIRALSLSRNQADAKRAERGTGPDRPRAGGFFRRRETQRSASPATKPSSPPKASKPSKRYTPPGTNARRSRTT
ncbi:MAG: hypothetical protein ACRD1G_14245 [Acidimicrobiales bacterium]